MTCRVCGSADLYKLWDKGGLWHRCLECGSDSSETRYEEVVGQYDHTYLKHQLESAGGAAGCERSVETNVDWFQRIAVPEKILLDIGCMDGAMLRRMMRLGWKVQGFDITDVAKPVGGEYRVQVAPQFRAALFPHKFGAIVCREVIEHVPTWAALLTEAWAALVKGGILQVQTPKPTREWNPIGYQPLHLQLFSPMAFRHTVQMMGFDPVDRLLWDEGQAWMLRRV